MHIVIIDGHPDRRRDRFIHALAACYAEGASANDHEVNSIVVSTLEFPLLSTSEDFLSGRPPASIRACQELIAEADHVVILFPLWLGAMPALLKAFFEQVFRPGFGFAKTGKSKLPKKLLSGKSARIVVTMGMPSLFYRLVYRAHSLKSLERNILAFCGIHPIRATVIGNVEGMTAKQRDTWLAKMLRLGRLAR